MIYQTTDKHHDQADDSRLFKQSPQTSFPSTLHHEIHIHTDQPRLCPFQPFVVRPHIARFESCDERAEEEIESRVLSEEGWIGERVAEEV
jgi:hypothetical protein